MVAPSGTAQLVLSYAGKKCELTPFLPRVKRLKVELARKNGRKQGDKQLQVRLERASTSKSLKNLMALMGPITAAINGLALYLHKLGSP
jgi:hypothetical protein